VRRLLVLLALAALAFPATSLGHPLGNFTVNRYSAIELSGESVYVRYVLDLAEIPTFQDGDEVRAPGYAGRLAHGLVLELDGRRVELVPLAHRVSERPGAGGLPTLRFEAVFAAETDEPGGSLLFRDGNFEGRLGWKEVVARASDGARIEASTVPAAGSSNALRSYPKNLLSSPLDVTSAQVDYEAGSGKGRVPTLGAATGQEARGGAFESLVARDDLGLGVVLVSLAIAMFWGAAHALTPGHGKAIVAGYLVGSRGTPRHAFALGAIVTATHTIGVFALGLVTLLLSQFIVPEELYPWLTVASGLLVVGVGGAVLLRRLGRSAAAHHHHHHDGGSDHGHGYSRAGLLGVGVSAGLLPCPSALVVLLSAIALHRIGLGLALIFAFSLGLAATVTAIGLVAVFARRLFGRVSLNGPLVRALPAVSALVIIGVGVGLTVNALPEVL
jgi:ABC-type nickel/cobalt efflux system permease component RcnA